MPVRRRAPGDRRSEEPGDERARSRIESTTLAYAVAKNEFGGICGIRIVLIALAVLLALGVLGGGASRRRRAAP